MAKVYAVKKGRTTGIFGSWEECKAQVDGYTGAQYKSFSSASEAAVFLGWTSDATKPSLSENKEELEIVPKDDSHIIAYVDGSYNIATGEYGSGAILITSKGEVSLSEKGNDESLASMRNVAGEIKGAEAAMRYAFDNGYKSLTIYHDYEGISKWCQGLWKRNKEGTIAYKEMYDILSKEVNIDFVKVKGHSGDKYNDIADELAKKAAGVE